MTRPGSPLASLRAAFPVLRSIAYLNAGTNGPLPTAASAAARAELAREEEQGRSSAAHWARVVELTGATRAGYAALLGCSAADVALTTSTTDGIARMLPAFDLGPGDEIVTSDEEHAGVLGPLVAQRGRGVEVRMAPFDEIADAVGPRTRLVVCSHVSWRRGAYAPAALGELDIPVLLDGAQGVGAVAVDIGALGVPIYAASGQKWLCGPGGSGLLYVSPAMRERLDPPAPGYVNLAEPYAGLDASPHGDARAYDTPAIAAASLEQAHASLDLLGGVGWPALHRHSAALAATAADALREQGREVLPRDDTTLVTWRDPDPLGSVERLAAAGVVVRPLPNEDLVRASFGGWSNEDDLDRLLTALKAR